MTSRAEAADSANVERQGISPLHERSILPRLEVPVVPEQREGMLPGMTSRLRYAESNVGSRLRLEDRRERVARCRAAVEAGCIRAEAVGVYQIIQRSSTGRYIWTASDRRIRRKTESRP